MCSIDRHELAAPLPRHLLTPVRAASVLAWCAHNVSGVQVAPIAGRFELGFTDVIKYKQVMEQDHISTDWHGQVIRDNAELHHMAAGDFMLMSRGAWHALRGFPENKTNDMIDSSMVVLAAVAGLRQVYITPPHRIYHQYHTRLEFSTRSMTRTEDFIAWRRWQYSAARPMLTNLKDTWGQGGESTETKIFDIPLECDD